MQKQSTNFTTIHDEEYANLVTFRKNGSAVATPIWFAQDQGNGLLYIETGKDSGKVKRIRHTARVTLAPCNARGKITGEAIEGRARVVTDVQETFIAKGALHRKYGLRRQVLYFMMEAVRILRRQPDEQSAYLAIEPV